MDVSALQARAFNIFTDCAACLFFGHSEFPCTSWKKSETARTTLNRFVETCPFVVISRVILDAVINEDLHVVFDEHRQQGYYRQLLYSHLTRTITQVVLGVCKTPNQAFNKLGETIAVSKKAFTRNSNVLSPKSVGRRYTTVINVVLR